MDVVKNKERDATVTIFMTYPTPLYIYSTYPFTTLTPSI